MECFEDLPKLEGIAFIARHRRTGETVEFTFEQLYGYEGEERGIMLGGHPNWTVKYNDAYERVDGRAVAIPGRLNPDLDIRVRVDENLPYALYMNGRLIARAVDRRTLDLGDIAGYIADNPDDLFVLIDERTGETIEKTNGKFDVWDKETDTLCELESLFGKE